MTHDSLRGGDRTVALADVMAEHGSGFAPRDSAPVVRALVAEVRRLRALEELLRRAWPYVASQNDSEHMLDGFAGRVARPSDGLLREIAAALAAAPPETGGTDHA